MWEDAASYHQLVQGAQVCKAPTIFIHLSQSMNWMMFSLMSFFLVVNLAVMMLELTGSQPMSAACASGANIRATPSVWGAPSSMCPEYSSCSPDESLSCPDCIHLVSHSPSTLILYLFISLATCTVFPVSYIVLMFHVASRFLLPTVPNDEKGHTHMCMHVCM